MKHVILLCLPPLGVFIWMFCVRQGPVFSRWGMTGDSDAPYAAALSAQRVCKRVEGLMIYVALSVPILGHAIFHKSRAG